MRLIRYEELWRRTNGLETAAFSYSMLGKATWALTSATGHFHNLSDLFGSHFSFHFNNKEDLTSAEKAISILPETKPSNLFFYFNIFLSVTY